MLARTDRRFARRRGAILLVTLTLLALFSVVALSFALYAESHALGSRTRREAVATEDGPPPVDLYASAALGQMLYGEPSASYGLGNNLLKTIRGHEDSTMVYGDNPNGGNTIPYNGVGQFSDPLVLPTATGGTVALDRRDVINYALQFPRLANGNFVATANHVVDPSHSGFRTAAQLVTSPGDAVTFPTKAYVARNAPYTYPDRLNVKVAMQDPNTGRILVPSFHRPSLFGSLDRTNQNWRDDASTVSANFNAAGRYKILRPRPWDHRLPGETEDLSQFPFPPANPDGTITGDVQNIAQTDGRQQNDSVWVDMGLPPMQWRGRWIQPLVAATILPLDGRVNVNVAATLNGGSTNGFGPWEIGLRQITGDANTMVSTRTGGSNPSPRGTNLAAFPFPAVAQNYAKVNWDATNATATMNLPTANTVAFNATPVSDPTYPAAGYDDAVESTGTVPQMFSPYSWNAFTSPGKLFPHTDLRRSVVRYAGKPNDYLAPYFGPTAPTSLTGTGPGNPSAFRRTLLTTASNSLARMQLQPNYRDYLTTPTLTPGARTLSLAGNTIVVNGMLNDDRQLLFPFATQPNGVPGTWATDYPQGTAADPNIRSYRNAIAQLGPLNLNRPLVDYRVDTTLSLADPANAGAPMLVQGQAAMADRNTFAREIFARLILATGAKAVVVNASTIVLPDPANGNQLTYGGASYPVTAQEYDVLRHLAQIAANIVDQRDNDDIATPFVWNPQVPATPLDPANFAPPELPNRVVFGVEKPRLILNEAYSELSNEVNARGMNMPGANFEVRFWVELINTTNNDVANSPLAGIPTSMEPTAVPGNIPFNYGMPASTYNFGGPAPAPYRLQVFRNGTAAVTDLTNPTNITGDVSGTPEIDIDSATFNHPSQQRLRWSIEPNNGQSQATNAAARNGIAVLGPSLTADPSGTEYVPTNNSMLEGNGGGSARMYYTRPPTDQMGLTNLLNQLENQTIVLRRLANPYLPQGPTNPYITVDYITHVHSEDAVRVVQGNMGGMGMGAIRGRGPGGMGPPGQGMNFLQIQDRESIGRIQPYMAAEGPQQNVPGKGQRVSANMAQSCVVLQNPQPAPMNEPKVTLFRHNSQQAAITGTDQTIRLPFEWLPQFDRPFVNQVELLHVAASRAHTLTHQFATIGATPTANSHVVPWGSDPLYRGLELLNTRPWGYGIPAEGRVPGKININMIWDQSVLNALLDQSAGNANASNHFQSGDVDSFWRALQGITDDTTDMMNYRAFSRTKNGLNVGPTVDEVGLTYTDSGGVVRGADRPFKPFGTASFTAGGLLPSGSGLADTLFRNTTDPMGLPTGVPAIFTAGSHPYQRAEMLRKMFNSVTTTSDTYLVVMTVGFFEVRNTPPFSTTNPLVLGKEVHNQSAGDLRGKFVAILDRSMMATDIAGTHIDGYYQTTLSEAPYQVGGAGPYYCRFAAQGVNGTTIQMVYEGRIVNVPIGGTIIVGTGANAEQFVVGTPPMTGLQNPDGSIAPTFNPATGLATVILTAAPTRLHHAGDSVSNGIHQNPGAQPNFDVNSSRYKGVVPYFERVEIGK